MINSAEELLKLVYLGIITRHEARLILALEYPEVDLEPESRYSAEKCNSDCCDKGTSNELDEAEEDTNPEPSALHDPDFPNGYEDAPDEGAPADTAQVIKFETLEALKKTITSLTTIYENQISLKEPMEPLFLKFDVTANAQTP